MRSVKFSDDPDGIQPKIIGKNMNNQYRFPPFPSCTYRFIPDLVSWLFGVYGYTLGRWPWPFLIIGLVTGLVSAAGFWRIKLATDSTNLIDQFLEADNRYVTDDKLVQRWMNESNLRQIKLQQQRRQQNIEEVVDDDGEEPPPDRRVKRQIGGINYCDYESYGTTWRSQNIMAVAKDENIFDEEVFTELLDLNIKLREMLSCSHDDFLPSQERFFCCDSWDLQRLQAELSRAGSSGVVGGKQLAKFFSTLTYPADKRFPMSPALFANFFGGVKTNNPDNAYNAKVISAKAMLFQYLLPNTRTSLRLEQSLTAKLKKLRNSYKTFDIYWQTWKQLEDEFTTEVFKEIPKVAATFLCVILWCITGALHTDAINSKPWCGLLGIGCTAFACAAGFGAQFWLGDQFYTYLIAVPLMALGIGLDDMFILLSHWHRSDINLPREQRAMLTLQEGGASIFTTALMTIIDFIIGTYTPYPAINTYSNFALWCLSFDFWLQMTVFMSILVLSDSCEKRNKHSCCCCLTIPSRTRNDMTKKAACTIICCTHGSSIEDSENSVLPVLTTEQQPPSPVSTEIIYQNIPADISLSESTSKESASKVLQRSANKSDDQPAPSEKFIYNVIAPAILHPVTRIIIALCLIGFLAGSLVIIWKHIRVGFRQEHLANRLSNTYDFSIYSWKYFRDYVSSQQLEIVFNFTTAPYNRNFTKIYSQVTEIVDRLEQSNTFVWDKRLNHVPMRDITMDNAAHLTLDEAIYAIADREPSNTFKPALVGDESDSERLIFLSTFQTRNIPTLERGASLAQFIRTIQSSYERGQQFRIIVTDWEQTLRIYDQLGNLPKQLVYFSLITLGSTVVASFLMIPHPICIFWLALSAACIIIGTVAGMVLWEVSLDPVSLIYLLMAIGATSDYICHTIFTFTVIEPVEEDIKPRVGTGEKKWAHWSRVRYGKARRMISYVVYETVPAVIGTLLSIVVLSTTHVYVLQAFFKVFLISVLVAFLFMSIVLPAALCQFGPTGKTCFKGADEGEGDLSGVAVEAAPENQENNDPTIIREERETPNNNHHRTVTTEIILTNSATVKPSEENNRYHRRSATSSSPNYGKKKETTRSAMLRNNTWKAKVLDRFLSDSKRYFNSATISEAPPVEPRIDAFDESTYANLDFGKKSGLNVGRDRIFSEPQSMPNANRRSTSSKERTALTTNSDTKRRSTTKEPVVQTTNKNNHSVLYLSSKHTFEENLRRHGVRRGVLNH